MCSCFYEKRPSQKCTNYQAPAVGKVLFLQFKTNSIGGNMVYATVVVSNVLPALVNNKLCVLVPLKSKIYSNCCQVQPGEHFKGVLHFGKL